MYLRSDAQVLQRFRQFLGRLYAVCPNQNGPPFFMRACSVNGHKVAEDLRYIDVVE